MTDTPGYANTRRAWRDIWTAAEFDREYATLVYPRAQALLNAYLPWLDRSLPILEAGCGPGHVVAHLRERGYNVVGLDYAPEALVPTHEQHPDLPLIVGDVHHLPYAEGTFGGYLSFGVVEHFEHGPLPSLVEAFRVLRPGATLVLSTPHPNITETLAGLADRLIPARTHQRPPRAAYYETTYTHEQLAAFASTAGFDVVRLLPYSHSFTFYGLHPVFRAPGYYATSRLAEIAGTIGRRMFPWLTAFECLVIARRP